LIAGARESPAARQIRGNSDMGHPAKIALALAVLLSALSPSRAQVSATGGEEPNDDPRGNINLGVPIVVPLHPTSEAVHLGFGFSLGGGYNFTRHHAAIGEFMWNHMAPTNEALAKLRTALAIPNLNANSNLYSLTGNYRYEMRGETLGAYLIAGGGLYFRHSGLSQKVTTGEAVVCQPIYLWWGFSCTSGTVTQDQTVGSFSTSAFGGNGGIGFTARVGDAPYRVYFESRYHYAPNKYISTQLINLSFGIRY
jgi:Outer membrane protein beta-barrel domain